MKLEDKKILLVDDDTSILNVLEIVLRKENFSQIERAENGVDALEKFYQYKPDLVVLDLMLPDLDGNLICKKIRSSSMTPILFLSAKSEEDDKLNSYLSGGDNYITKPFSPKEVVASILSMLRRDAYYRQQVPSLLETVSFGDCIFDPNTKELYRHGLNVPLSAKEYHVLAYLITHRDKTVSKEELLEQVWDIAFDGYDNTVMVHIRKLREKLEQTPSTPLHIITIKGRGYRFVLDSQEGS